MSDKTSSFKDWLKLVLASLILGILGGVVGACFSLAISFVTTLRTSYDWLLFLLPAGGLLIVFIYEKLKISGISTNNVLKACENEEKLSPWLSVGIFVTSAISHLLGASVGREGAALQIGGSLSTVVSKFLRLKPEQTGALIRAGMAGVFAAVFGTPFAAFFFALEIVKVGTLHIKSVIPCFISSITGFFAAFLIGAHPERFSLSIIPSFSLQTVLKVATITILTSLLSIGFCYALKYSSKFAKQIFPIAYHRIALGGAIIILLTIIIGSRDYNGAGINIIENIFNDSSFRPEAFALKMLFTCVCIGAGYKGGEIVPTLFIGATFGALLASVLGFSVPFGAALGMVILFCGVTNCPLASLFLGIELFSGVGMWYFIPCIAVSYLVSGKISLYSAQQHKFKYI